MTRAIFTSLRFFVALGFWAFGFPSYAANLEIGLSTDMITISSDFSGHDVVVFGAIANAEPQALRTGTYDVVVVLEGPTSEAVARRKERVAGIWANRQAVRFRHVPASYSLTSTKEIGKVADRKILVENNIGVDNLRFTPVSGISSPGMETVKNFSDALKRLKLASGLYQRSPEGVGFIASGSLFRAPIAIPANIPVGIHTLRAYLFTGGELSDVQSTSLRVEKVGLEQFVYDFAYERSLLYGLFSVFLAVLTGWLGSLFFRKR